MEGILILIALIAGTIYIGVIVAATIIASRLGRSAIGWCVLTMIFPIAVLFVAIAAPANAYYVQQPPSSPPNPYTPASTFSSSKTEEITSGQVHSTGNTNNYKAQILGLLRQNPMIFGVLALLPSALQMIYMFSGFSFVFEYFNY